MSEGISIADQDVEQSPHHVFPLKRFRIILVLIMAAILAGGIWLTLSQEKQARTQAAAELISVARLKLDQIAGWRRVQLAEAHKLMMDELLIAAIYKWMQSREEKDSNVILNRLRTVQRLGGYRDIVLTDPEGKVLLSTGSSKKYIDAHICQVLPAANRNRLPLLSELHTDPNYEDPHISAVAPLFLHGDPNQKVFAHLMLVHEARAFLYPLIQSWPGPSRTAETLLVQKTEDGVLVLSELRFRAASALRFKLSLDRKEDPAVMAVSGRSGAVLGSDYRGVKVIAACYPVADSSWFMVAKIDEAEILAEGRTRSLLVLVLTVGLLAITGMGAIGVARRYEIDYLKKLYRSQADRRKLESRHRVTLMSISDGVIVTDVEGKIEFLNQAAEKLTGWKDREARGMPLETVFRLVKETASSNGRQRNDENGQYLLMQARDGSKRAISRSVSSVVDEKGNATGNVIVFRDQSAEYAVRQTLHHHQVLLSRALDLAHLGPWEYDAAQDLFTFNDEFYRVLNTTAEKEGGYQISSARYIERFVHPEDRAKVFSYFKAIVKDADAQNPFKLEHRFVDAEGRTGYFAIHVFAEMDESGRVLRTYGVNQDITERKLAEEALQEREKQYRLIAENVADVIWLYDLTENRFLYMSPSVEKLRGYTVHEVIAQKPEEVFTPECRSRIQRLLIEQAAAFESGNAEMRTRTYQAWQPRKDGSVVCVEMSVTLIPDAEGRVRQIQGVTRDITERNALEQQVIEAQKMEAVGRLAGGIAHDFNNLLTVIIGYSDYLMDAVAPEDPIREAVLQIKTAGESSAALVSKLLTFSRKQVVQPRVLDMNSLVSDTVKLLNPLLGENVELVLDLEPDLWLVNADITQMEQVVFNLAINARDAMPQGGKVIIKTANIPPEKLPASPFAQRTEYVMLSVSDTGIGMDEETKSHLFEPFFTTKEKGKGTGLGLSTVYGIIRQSNGYIDVRSQLRLGSVFEVYLPRFTEPAN